MLDMLAPSVTPGFMPLSLKLRKSGMQRGLRRRPPFATGLALIRRFPVGGSALNSGISRPLLSNFSSGL